MNTARHRLMCILAHPDDESLATGGILAYYSSAGVATALICATRGECGWTGAAEEYPGPAALGQIRAGELRDAAGVLGLRELHLLDYLDGELDRARPTQVVGRLVAQIRRFRPQVVVTFDPFGYYGHPDHIAISQWTTAAISAAADPSSEHAPMLATHQVAKLYYIAPTEALVARYQAVFGDLVMPVDGVARRFAGWPDWAVTTRIDTAAHWRRVWEAVGCHRSQLPSYERLLHLPEATHRELWGVQTFYRALSLVGGGRAIERDLFAGLR
jgi:LmbE family N-acetylglucosaminyl deacetylase